MLNVARTVRRAQRRVLFVLSSRLVRLVGFAGTWRLGAFMGALQYHLARSNRARCQRDLAQLQGRAADDPVIARQLREAYRVNTVAVLQVLAMFDRALDVAALHEHCRIDGLGAIDAARRGKGVILLGTHSGNSLLMVARLASEGHPVTLLYRQARMMSSELFAAGLPRYGIQGIPANEGFKAYARMLAALRGNGIVFAMMDQGVKLASDGLPMRFLGKQMPMPGGVAQLARASGAPVLPVVTLGAQPVWHFAVQPPVYLDPGSTLAENVQTLLQLTEGQVLERPQLWSWHQRRWRKFPLTLPAKGVR